MFLFGEAARNTSLGFTEAGSSWIPFAAVRKTRLFFAAHGGMVPAAIAGERSIKPWLSRMKTAFHAFGMCILEEYSGVQ